MTEAEILRAAAEIIEERGWWNGRAPALGECVGTAIFEAAPRDKEGRVRARRAFREHTRVAPIAWNDAPDRTKADVLAALRGAAAQVEAGR